MADLTDAQQLLIDVEGYRKHLSIFSIEVLAELELIKIEIVRLIELERAKQP